MCMRSLYIMWVDSLTSIRLTTGFIVTWARSSQVANHPRIILVDEARSVTLPTHWACVKPPLVGAGRRIIPIMSDVGFEPTTSQLYAHNSNHYMLAQFSIVCEQTSIDTKKVVHYSLFKIYRWPLFKCIDGLKLGV